MAHRYVSSAPDLPAAPSPISQAVVAGNHCYVSGQLSVDSTGTFRPGSAREEATQAFANVFAALRAAGFSREDIVYVDVAFIDLRDILFFLTVIVFFLFANSVVVDLKKAD